MANLCPDPLMCPWQRAQLCRSHACVSLAQQWFYNTAARWANALDPTCLCFYQMLTQSERRKRLDQNENNAGCCAMCSLRNQEVRKQSTCFRNSIRGTSCLSRPKKHRWEGEGCWKWSVSSNKIMFLKPGPRKLQALKLATKHTELWQFAPIKNFVTDCFWLATPLPAEKPLLQYAWWIHIITGWAEIQSPSTGQGSEKKNTFNSWMFVAFENIWIEIIIVLFNTVAS